MEKWIRYLDEIHKPTEPDPIPEPTPPEKQHPALPSSPATVQTIPVAQVKDIRGLIDLVLAHPLEPNTEYNIQLALLHEIYPELCELDNMIGMKAVKSSVLDQLLYFLQGLHKNDSASATTATATEYVDYKHTVLIGPPGTGKTELAKILGRLFLKISIQGGSGGTFKKVTRNDLVGGYLGQTAIKTKDVIQKCLGGVLFIDEAYSLNQNTEKTDTYARECVDILCESLSFHRNDLMVILAGYEKEMTEFLKSNEGLESRFIWRYKIEPYTHEELACIFLKMCDDQGWTVDYDRATLNRWFGTNRLHFKSYGRDVEKLLTQVKIKHGRRLFGGANTQMVKKCISMEDMDDGLTEFIRQRVQSSSLEKNAVLHSMYV